MKPFSTILVPIDLFATSEVGIESGSRLAELVGAGRLHLVHVIQYSQFAIGMPDSSGALTQAMMDALINSSKERLSQLTSPSPRIEVTRETRFGAPAREIVSAAEECGADLVVIASANRGPMGRLVLGSVAHTVLRAAPCPVLVVGENRPFLVPQRILAAIDLSPVSGRVLQHAIDLARVAGARVDVLSSYDLLWVPPTWMESAPLPLDDAARADLMEKHRVAVDALIESVGIPEVVVASTVVPSHPPSKVIVDHAQKSDADLIVVGASGHNAWQRLFLGSTATHVLSGSHCPVLVVPA